MSKRPNAGEEYFSTTLGTVRKRTIPFSTNPLNQERIPISPFQNLLPSIIQQSSTSTSSTSSISSITTPLDNLPFKSPLPWTRINRVEKTIIPLPSEINLSEEEEEKSPITQEFSTSTTEGEEEEESFEFPIQYREAGVLEERLKQSVNLRQKALESISLDDEIKNIDATKFRPDVINQNMNYCVDISNMRHTYNGKLHCIIAIPSNYFTEESRVTEEAQHQILKDKIMITLATRFEIVTIGNTPFGTLNFSMNSMDSHSLLRLTINASIYTARCLLFTGGLAGYDIKTILSRFSTFVYWGTVVWNYQLELGGDLTKRYLKYKAGPFDILKILQPYPKSQDDLMSPNQKDLVEEIVGRFLEIMNRNEGLYSKSSSDSDASFLDYNEKEEKYLDEKYGNQDKDHKRFGIVQRRMEEVSFKFYPQALQPLRVKEVRPFRFTPYILDYSEEDGGTTIVPQIDLRGNRDIDEGIENRLLPSVHTEPEEGEQVGEVPEERGPFGCMLSKSDRLECAILRSPFLWDPENIDDNDCFFRCLIKGLKDLLLLDLSIPESESTQHLRLKVGNIEHQNHINIDETQTFSTIFNVEFHYWHIVTVKNDDLMINSMTLLSTSKARILQEFVEFKVIKPTPPQTSMNYRIDFLIYKKHCYLLLNFKYVVDKVKCSLCTQWINKLSFLKHSLHCCYCFKCRRSYSTKRVGEHVCQGKSIYLQDKDKKSIIETEDKKKEYGKEREIINFHKFMREVKNAKKMTPTKKIWLVDIEAFPDFEDYDTFKPYAIGIINLSLKQSGKPIIFYGESAMMEYLNYLDQISGTLIYFNGSAFDNFIHLRGMIDHSRVIDTNSFIKHGSRIIQFKAHSKLKVLDLYLFIKSSLKDACKSWGVPSEFRKTDFDHTKVFNFKSAEKHREEVSEYLKFDVLALAYLYDIYSKTMFECFSMDINKSITPSQFAIQAWSSMTPKEILKELLIPHKGKEEDDDRAAYYGGRVMCQRITYESTEYDFNNPSCDYDYDKIEDYLIYADVNSLYPKAQVMEKYAVGAWSYFEPKEEDQPLFCSKINLLVNEDWIKRCMFKVNVRCPKDLITSFLMERDDKTKLIVHNLNNKVEQWYWGTELIEAVILGYAITRVHEVKQFPQRVDLFTNYVNICWQGRKNNPRPSQKNEAFKFALNGLTGKFGQKSNETNSVIMNANIQPTKRNEKEFELLLSRVVDFTPMFSKDGVNCAMMMELDNENKDPNYPIYISAQILANSRVHMSRIMRACNAYLDPLRAIYYTDTDSLIMPIRNLEDLVKGNYIGKELGQMKCDLSPTFFNNQFAKILYAIFGATKGPYSIVYLNRGESKLMEVVKMKGVPHTSKPFSHDLTFLNLDILPKEKERLDDIMRWVEEPFKFSLPTDLVKQRFYFYKTKGNVFFVKHINCTLIKQILLKAGELFCFYGGMKRRYYDISITPTIIRRMLCKTNWWAEGKRIFKDGQIGFTNLSFPPGYYEEHRREEINYHFESLLRLSQLF